MDSERRLRQERRSTIVCIDTETQHRGFRKRVVGKRTVSSMVVELLQGGHRDNLRYRNIDLRAGSNKRKVWGL